MGNTTGRRRNQGVDTRSRNTPVLGAVVQIGALVIGNTTIGLGNQHELARKFGAGVRGTSIVVVALPGRSAAAFFGGINKRAACLRVTGIFRTWRAVITGYRSKNTLVGVFVEVRNRTFVVIGTIRRLPGISHIVGDIRRTTINRVVGVVGVVGRGHIAGNHHVGNAVGVIAEVSGGLVDSSQAVGHICCVIGKFSVGCDNGVGSFYTILGIQCGGTRVIGITCRSPQKQSNQNMDTLAAIISSSHRGLA